MAKVRLQITADRSVHLEHVFQNSKWMSSDPKATIDARWGLDKCSIIAIYMRRAQESIAFIKKRYGKNDPLFAERSLRIQQSIVDEMNIEGKNNGCTASP